MPLWVGFAGICKRAIVLPRRRALQAGPPSPPPSEDGPAAPADKSAFAAAFGGRACFRRRLRRTGVFRRRDASGTFQPPRTTEARRHGDQKAILLQASVRPALDWRSGRPSNVSGV